MNLLPLQIVLGFQVFAALVIFIQLMKRDDDDRPLQAAEARRLAKRRLVNHSFGEGEP